ncbi:DUF4911 domain-containing protein [Desulfotalea psychrophila]|uniref:DUF4911 domain-containing protein n=1 Tax=Desulfotalea psychrophila TaxID=84980 RepID=UPI000318CA9D|nr:DUF4911 domain-containing protein [Desulfotalea psychrophila]
MNTNLESTYLRITPSQFHFLKFILEGYDNLAVLSSEDGKAGIVRLRYPEELRADVFAILTELAPRLNPLLSHFTKEN